MIVGSVSRSLLRFGVFALLLTVSCRFALSQSRPVAQRAAKVPPCTFSSSTTPEAAVIRVTDLSHALLPNAAVEVRCGKTVRNTIADEKGEAHFELRPGQYTVLTRMPGFADTARTVDLPAALEPMDIAMPMGSATDVINVTADTGFVPFASNAGSKTNALLVEVPQSISIVNEAEMNARHVITVNEALRYTRVSRRISTVSSHASTGSRSAASLPRRLGSIATGCASIRCPASWIPSNWRALRC